ncbi:MAG: DNA methyltransferase [Candidatus Saccharimonadales bacterium]
MNLLLFGVSPDISLAEATALYGEKTESINKQTALIRTAIDFKRIGGSFAAAKLIKKVDSNNWQQILQELESVIRYEIKPNSKTNLGISIYGLSPKNYRADLINLKKKLRAAEYKIRVVFPQAGTELSSAQIIHNGLATDQLGLVVSVASNKAYIGRTRDVQNIESYTLRDRGRPKRDAKVGMLPPKLAQIMLNLANPSPNSTVLDPFCGTGVVLQEALLMGFSAIGGDIDSRMVEYTQTNLDWGRRQFEFSGNFKVSLGDATKTKWKVPIDAVVSEIDLGPPHFNMPPILEIKKLQKDADKLIGDLLENLADQLEPGTPLCLAIPAWSYKDKFLGPEIANPGTGVDRLHSLGYNRKRLPGASNELYYAPHGQIVARKLLILERFNNGA